MSVNGILIRDGLRESLKALDLNLLVTKDSYASPTVTSFIPQYMLIRLYREG
jgi:aspartate aminotransferase-like enzyme